MKKRKNALWGTTALALTLALTLCACGSDAPDAASVSEEESAQEEVLPPVEETAPQAPEVQKDFTFADVATREFYFSSGAGGWFTELRIAADGSFTGRYEDTDLGSVGEEHPNGTVYLAEFTGRFTAPEKVDDTTYVFKIDSIDYGDAPTSEIRDGVRYERSEANGLVNAENFYMYLPESPLETLPEGFLMWVGYPTLEGVQETELGIYGLYNEKDESGFTSFSLE